METNEKTEIIGSPVRVDNDDTTADLMNPNEETTEAGEVDLQAVYRPHEHLNITKNTPVIKPPSMTSPGAKTSKTSFSITCRSAGSRIWSHLSTCGSSSFSTTTSLKLKDWKICVCLRSLVWRRTS